MNWSDFFKKLFLVYFSRRKVEPKPKPEKPIKPKPVEPKPVEPKPEPAAEELLFHHYNPNAWHGQGSAIVFCPGQRRFDSVTINGLPMSRHGAKDKGRDVWTIYSKPRITGQIVAYRGNKQYKVSVTADKMNWGQCS